MLRGINRQNIFEDGEDCERFLNILKHYKFISNYLVYAYCLMNNHIHLLLKENHESIGKAIKRISSGYVYWYNNKYKRCGHLFQERFKSEVVETDEYFLTVIRYIHLNPVKAGIINDAEQYKWSSYREYTGTPIVTDITYALDLLSPNREHAKKMFQDFNNQNNHDKCLEHINKVTVSDEEIRELMNSIGIISPQQLQQLEKPLRNAIIRQIKNIPGVTTRQLANLTGISKSVIDRV